MFFWEKNEVNSVAECEVNSVGECVVMECKLSNKATCVGAWL
jgi:hypothetical protein